MIFITEDIKNYKKGQEILSKISDYKVVKDKNEFIEIIKKQNLSYIDEKKNMFFGVKKGKFLKQYYLDKNFVGIKEEYYLTYENNCPFNCLYCYLRDYYQHGAYMFYVNIEDMFLELDNFKEKGSMISCGIVNDSLVYDNITNINSDLINYFRNRDDIKLEIRSKSNNIKNLLNIDPSDSVIVSFTFSPQEIIDKYELGTSNLDERIEAAYKLQNIGYNIGIRIDPIIAVTDFEIYYNNMLEKIFSTLDRKKIINIGIGGLRYKKGLKKKVLKEVKTDLFFNEIIVGIDGKERYFKPLRIKMYRLIVNKIREYGNFDIYLGMEPKYVWDEVFV
ncbi:SPL family radical SAM protein [Haliovirga abyssi]|uniref:Radical SAM protein n=1 Tax=Haliovirga abyssi TaxID=2996794 RepID=A0AAU9D3D7_9FUSO|nr:hypothetical protein [Haliovirga abyssi]BDU50471.1 hypothetical protein HLVA_10400 [Haliovirga abyssi]